jgi:hypothetical protein
LSTAIILVIVLVVIFFLVRGLLGSRPSSRSASFPGSTSASATLPPQNVEDALADLATCVRPKETGNLSTVVQVRIQDHTPADWHFDLSNGECSLLEGPSEVARLTITASTRTWIDLAAKRMSFSSAYMKGDLRVEGDNVIVMRLDDEFSGPVDPSRHRAVRRAVSASIEERATTGDDAAAPDSDATGSQALLPGEALAEVLRVVRDNPNLTRRERHAAIVRALRESVGSTEGRASLEDAKTAIQKAVAGLPPGASRGQKLEALRTALSAVPGAEHYAVILSVLGPGGAGHSSGIGGEAAGMLVEGFLESLLGGD